MLRKSLFLPSLGLAGLLFCPLAAHAIPNIYEVHALLQENKTTPPPAGPASANLDGFFTYDVATNSYSNVQLLLTNVVVNGLTLADSTLTSVTVANNFFAANTRTLFFGNAPAAATRQAFVTFNNPPGLPAGGSTISLNADGTGFFYIPELSGISGATASSGTITAAPEIDGASACLPLAWAAMGLALLSDRRRRRL